MLALMNENGEFLLDYQQYNAIATSYILQKP